MFRCLVQEKLWKNQEENEALPPKKSLNATASECPTPLDPNPIAWDQTIILCLCQFQVNVVVKLVRIPSGKSVTKNCLEDKGIDKGKLEEYHFRDDLKVFIHSALSTRWNGQFNWLFVYNYAFIEKVQCTPRPLASSLLGAKWPLHMHSYFKKMKCKQGKSNRVLGDRQPPSEWFQSFKKHIHWIHKELYN